MEEEAVNSQFNYDRPWFNFIHFHEGKTLCAGEPLLRFVMLEFKEDSCPCEHNTSLYYWTDPCLTNTIYFQRRKRPLTAKSKMNILYKQDGFVKW